MSHSETLVAEGVTPGAGILALTLCPSWTWVLAAGTNHTFVDCASP